MTLATMAVVGSIAALDEINTPVAAPTSRVVAAIPYWDRAASLDSLHDRVRDIDVAATFFYTVKTDGSVQPEPSTVSDITKLSEIRSHTEHLNVIPSVANTTGGSWDPDTIARILRNSSLRARHIESLAALASDGEHTGVQIDYEDLHAEDRELFSSFISDLSHRLSRINKVLYVTVHPKEDNAGYDQRNVAQDYAAIGRSADKVVVMAYDRHWENSSSGPIAPFDWVENVVRYATAQIPPGKVLLGIPLYGYDWAGAKALPLTWREARELSTKNSASETWDPVSGSTYFTYQRDGVNHDVWFENARSTQLKIRIAQEYQLGGILMWRLGGEDPATWTVVP